DLLVLIQGRHRLQNCLAVLREDPRDQLPARFGQGSISSPPVAGALQPFDQPPVCELVDQVGDSSTRDQDLPLKLTEQHRTLVMQSLEYPKLAAREAVALDVSRHQLTDRRLGPHQHHQELDSLLLLRGGPAALGDYIGSKHLSSKIVFHHLSVNPCPSPPHRKLPTSRSADPGAAGKKHCGSINSASINMNSPPLTIPSIRA